MENLFARTIPTRVFGNFRKSFTFLGVLGALCLSMNATPLWAVCTPSSIDDATKAAAAVTCSESADTLGLTATGLTVTVAIDLAGGDDTFSWSDSAFGTGGSLSGGAGSDTIRITGGTLALDGGKFELFEVLSVTAGAATQTNTFDLGTGGAATFSGGTYTISADAVLQANSFTLSTGGTLAGAGTASGTSGADTFTLNGGTLSANVDLGAGADTFTWSGGTVTGAVDGGDDSDTIAITGGVSTLDGALFTNFEVLTVAGSSTGVNQRGTLNLGEDGAATFSGGSTYTISAGGVLQVNTVTVNGTLSGGGAIMMGDGTSTFTLTSGSVAVAVNLGGGDDTFTWSGGTTVTGAVDAGDGSDTLAVSGGTKSLNGALFTNFEVLMITSALAIVTQTGTLDLGTGGSATFSGGTYTINTGIELQVNTILVDGGTLAGAGSVMMGDGDDTFTWRSGTVTVAAVNAGAGEDKLVLSGGTSSTPLAVTDGLFTNFEVLEVTGSATVVTQTGTFDLGSGSATFSAGRYVVAASATLQANTITVDGGTVAFGGNGAIVMGTGNVASSFTIESGSVQPTVTSLGGADTFTVRGGIVSGDVATGSGDDTFTVSGTGTVSGAVNLGAGGDTFTFSGGTVTGMVNAGADEDTLVLTGGITEAAALAVNGALFSGFERLTATGSIDQSGALDLGAGGTVEISGENAFYTVVTSATLGTATNAVAITLNGPSVLEIEGKVFGDISSTDDGEQCVHIFASDPFGTAARTIDLGAGVDILQIDTDTADVTLGGNTSLTFRNIEILHLTGAANGFDWGGALTIASAAGYDGSGFHTLQFDVGGIVTSVQNVVFEDGSTIIIEDDADVSTKSVAFSSDGTITLPESGERLSIALHSTSGDAFTVTLTLNDVINIAGLAAVTELEEDILSVFDSTLTVSGSVSIRGADGNVVTFADGHDATTTTVDLTLTLSLPAHFVSVAGGNARVTTLNRIFTAGSGDQPALLAAAQTAASAASNPGLASVSFANSLVPEDYAHFSPLVARSQSLTVGRILDRLGSGSTAQSDDVTNTDSWTSRSKPWVSISTRSGELDTTDDESGYDNSIEMAVAGIDIALGGGGVFGAFAGRSELTQELNSKDRKDLGAGNPLKNFSKINYSTAFFGVYGERRLSNLRLSLLGSYATGNASVRGATEIGTTLQRRKADFDMDILSGQLRVSWDFEGRVFGMQVEPVLDAIWTKVDRSSVDETRTIGNATGIVRIGEDRYESLIASGGFNLTQQDDRKRIDISVGWRQEIKDGDPASRATVTGASSSAFDVDGRTPWSGAAYISASIGRAQQAFGSQGYIELFLDHENDLDEYEGFSLGVRIRSTF